jgi:hypothetical protein
MPIKIGTSMNEITATVNHSYIRVEPKNKVLGLLLHPKEQTQD